MSESKRTTIVPIRTYAPEGLDALVAALTGETEVGHGKALVTVTFSSALAGEVFAKCNHGNRPLRQANINAYKAAMSEGRWGDSTLIFGLFDGNLRVGDGQNRLTSQHETGTTQSYSVRVYTDEDDFQAAIRRVDARGSARNVRDMLVIEGLMPAGPANAAEAAINKMTMFDGTAKRGTALDLETRVVYAERRHKSLVWAITKIPPRTFKPAILAALIFAHAKDPKAAEEIVARVISAEGLRGGTPEHTFALSKESLNCAKSAFDVRRAMAQVMRLVYDFKNERKTSKRVEVMCLPTQEAVERYAGKAAWATIKLENKKA